ncbi:glycosyltransferase [Agromyces sp. NPDC057679]|uniref:glycosyltransferase n=1 Tax=Agromyces sp. NPDC057679 TaxID=3346207 RepID=UPI00366E22AB
MRILFIHEVNYLMKVIFEMHEFPELLALRGHDVTFFHYPESAVGQRRNHRASTHRIHGRAYPEAALELVTPPTWGGGAIGRLTAPIVNIPTLSRLIRTGGFDAIVLYAVPTTGWQTVRIAKRAGVPVIFRALDVSHRIRRTPFAPLIRLAERYIYRNADLLSANNPAMAAYCVEASGRTGPSEVHLPPVDVSHFAVGDRKVRPEFDLTDEHRVILYMGSFFEFSGLDDVLRSMVGEFERDPMLRLMLVGGGTIDESLRELAVELGIDDRVIFTGVVPYLDLPSYLKAADVAINPFRSELVTNVAFPHKVLQYMAAGVPAVSTSLTGLRGVLGDASGVTWADGPAGVAAEAVRIAHLPLAERRSITTAQEDFVARTFSIDGAVAALERSLTEVG